MAKVNIVFCDRRKRRCRKCGGTVEVGENRRRDEHHGHNIRQNGGRTIRAKMGCYQTTGYRLFPEQVPERVQR